MPDQIRYKLDRADHHFEGFQDEVKKWINVPGKMVPTPSSTPGERLYVYECATPIPDALSLIAGDFLQNFRSALDYMVWCMIVRTGAEPKGQVAFPVCKSTLAWDRCYRTRLRDVPKRAVALIESLQPYPDRRTNNVPLQLEVLDELNNHNKHRQLLLTTLNSMHKPDGPIPIPYIEFEVKRNFADLAEPGITLIAYLGFQNKVAAGMEVASVLNVLKNYVRDVIIGFNDYL